MKILNKRMMLEKKYCDICLYNELPLEQMGNRILAISPSSFYHHVGINAKGDDVREYKRLSKKAHFGKRKIIEDEVFDIINYNNTKKFLSTEYFCDLKKCLYKMNIDQLNSILIKSKSKPIRKNSFNRLKKLLRIWSQESISCHFKINGARKRLHKKFVKRSEEYEIDF